MHHRIWPAGRLSSSQYRLISCKPCVRGMGKDLRRKEAQEPSSYYSGRTNRVGLSPSRGRFSEVMPSRTTTNALCCHYNFASRPCALNGALYCRTRASTSSAAPRLAWNLLVRRILADSP